MTKTDTVDARWTRELDKHSRRDDGSRELRQFHTAVGAANPAEARSRRLSPATTVALAVGNGAVMGALLGSLFGTTSGLVTGALVSIVGYLWISGLERKHK